VANAGLGDGSRLQDVPEEQFDVVFGVNTKGSLLTVQKSLPLLPQPASVILLASTTIHQGAPRMGVYAASKAAVRSLGRTWAAELAPRGVRVNVITPGPIATPAIDRVAGRLGLSSEDFHAALASQLPLQRMGRLGVEGVADEVEVEAVLDGLRLRHGHSEHLAWTRWEVQVPEGMAAGFRWRCGRRRRRRPRP
jgi:NAD(P)-dependent dehydrogenase (short-subunit alcohol dehydrogenase family)